MSMEESISLEETNKIRISLGLKPLTDDRAPADDKDKQAEDNYAKARDTEVKARESKAIQERIAKVRNRRELHASLKGSTLGDADNDTDDTLKWIKKAKKREKALAKKRQEEMESMDKMFQDEYSEKDLVGLKVSHDFEELEEGEARILTLKDSRILDNEGKQSEDELQNVEMAEEDRRKKNQELKIKRPDYTGYDDDEFAPGSEGLRKSVLAKYDEVLEGPKETSFRLGASATTPQAARQEKQQAASCINKSLLSIDYEKNLEITDYLKEGDVGFKKPKTKKKRPSRRLAEASEDTPAQTLEMMDIDEKPVVPRLRDLDANFVDDEELQAALTRSRKAKIRKSKKLTPEEIAQKISDERAREEVADGIEADRADEQSDANGLSGLTIDDTSEFVRSITFNPIEVKSEPTIKKESSQPSAPRLPSVGSDIAMPDIDQPMDEVEAGELVVKEEEEDEEAMLNAIESALKETEEAEKSQLADAEVGTSSEQTFSGGMASTLTILRQQGILAAPKADMTERERVQKQRDFWLAEQRRRLAERELEKVKSRGSNKDQATREYENRLREQQEAREQLEMFKNYKPDVNIVYYDEFGREMGVKEAWKALSHKFHGKGSGKMKTEKRLKKIAEEKKQEAMASGDTPLSMNRAFQLRQEKTGQAHFVLSVGNRGAVPQAEEFLDSHQLSKGKSEKGKGRKKDKESKASAPQVLDSGFITLPAPTASYGDSPIPASPLPGSAGYGSPAPRPGFKSITAAATPVDSPSERGTPVPNDRMRVALSLKRKATEEVKASPPPKRR
ncbi:hypothetical protein JAAARDRAFT_192758 [Jaapia argillacea MUCL 33604]|uniref:SART-1 protein n=1 Tax=Jaapia argillacea MUCL 33604 TaxID=933084 RepID=A0A067Q6W6_9AGAM|nr:hypothetical protein JAAARDRAFT_192758 [Jaapia argillacea MUCL 33604]